MQTSLVLMDDARRFIHDCLRRVGVPVAKLRCISDVILAADYRGVYGTGINRLELYLRDINQRYCRYDVEPQIISETVAAAHVDGKNAIGALVGNFCMDLAVEKAKKAGIGFVVAKRSHHIGLAAWYAFRAMAQGFIGLVMSNAAPMMVAPGTQTSTLGANCLAFGAKGKQSHIMLDMSTAMKEVGAIEWAMMKNEHIPDNWAMNDCGSPTCFPSLALAAQRLYPAGEHKGYCLSAMIDVLCGVMSGANYSTRIPRWWAECQGHSPDLGLVMLAIDPAVFVSDFEGRLDDFCERITSSCPVDENCPVKLPGELEKQHMYYVDDLRALPYPNVLLSKYKSIADMLCVEPLKLSFECKIKKKECD
ncbi:CG18808 [Drosophila busckii]|uniref:CG18808 n=2 Tax=Drosophila busckii TaxID=30019 RepID=A0A0M3QVV6_DROBS|nr:CG18808 [Drosophila busckii]